MGGDSNLGLLFTIDVDATQAREDAREFARELTGSFHGVRDATEPLNKSLLSNRESARLLTEELGVHLPRAVTGAIAEMMPAIGGFGGVLLGAFAIQEVPKLVAGIKEAVQSWEGFGKAEQEAMARAIKDTVTLHGKVVDIEKDLELFGKNEAEQAVMRAKWAGEDSDRALKSLLTAEGKVSDINAKIAEAKRGAGVFAAGAGGAYEGALKVAQAEVGKLREAWKAADEQALLAQKRAAEASAELTKKTVADQEKAVALIYGTGGVFIRDSQKFRDVYFEIMAEMGKALAADNKGKETAAKDQAFLNKLTFDYMVTISALTNEEQRRAAIARSAAPTFQIVAEANAVKHLSDATKEYILVKQDANRVSQAFADAMKAEVAAIQEDMLGGVKQLAEGGLALIGSQKAAAAFKAGYEVAEGIACLASGTWPPNPAAIIAAGLHFEAAAQYALMGGGGGGGRHGGPGGSQSSYGGSAGSGGAGSGPGGSGGGSGARGPTIVMNMYGPLAGSYADLAKALTPVFNSLGASGQVRLTSYNSLTNGAKQT